VFAWFECFADSASLQSVVGNTVASWVDPGAIVSATTGLTLTQLDARSVGIDVIPTGVPSVAVDAVFRAPSAATWPCPASSDPPSVIVSEAFDAFVASTVSRWPFVHCPIEKIVVLPAADPRQAVVVQITSNLNQSAVDAISSGLLSATRAAPTQPTDTPTAASTSIPTASAAPTMPCSISPSVRTGR
jgi:hypothetical protein